MTSATPLLPVPYDRVAFTALEGAVDPAEVRAFRRAARESGSQYARSGTSVVAVVLAVVIVVVVFTILGTVFGTLFLSFAQGGGELPLVLLVAPMFVVVAVVLVIRAIVRRMRRGGTWQRWFRLDGFASANGFGFVVSDADPAYPGIVFGIGRERTIHDVLRAASGRFVELGSYRYTTGSDDNRRVSTWGYIAVALDRPVPHLLLDARANDGVFSSLPAGFDRSQVLSLEGDFDRHFTLYTPREYERDALYLLTPDLMAVLIDEAAEWDVELIDRWLFLYSPRPIDALDSESWRRALRTADLVGSKVLDRTRRYADDRANAAVAGESAAPAGARAAAPPVAPEAGIAPGGQRLRRGIRWAGVAGMVAVVAWWIVVTWLSGR